MKPANPFQKPFQRIQNVSKIIYQIHVPRVLVYCYHIRLINIIPFRNKIRKQSSMKLNPIITLSQDHQLPKKYNLPSDIPHSRIYINQKILTQQSTPKYPISASTAKHTHQISKKHSKAFAQVSKSQTYINSLADSKEYLQSQKCNNRTNKNISIDHNPIFKHTKEIGNGVLAKKSVQIMIGLNKGMFKTQYSKINRRKEEIIRKNTLQQNQQKIQSPIHHIEEFSEQKLIEKYRELIQKKEKSRPFNMVNKLYQIQYLSAKEASILPKEGFKPTSMKLNICNRANHIEAKVNKFNQKPDETHKVRDMLLCSSQKVIKNQIQPQSPAKNKSIIHKPLSQQKYKQDNDMQPIQFKDMKQLQSSLTDKIDITLRLGDMGIREQIIQKVQRYQSGQSPSKLQRQNQYPPPKKVTAAAYIIYQIIQQKTKPSFKRGQYQTIKRKDYAGKVHSSYNIKSTSQIASLTKIMTCVTAIQICQRFGINPQLQKYKIGCFQSYIRGTSANIQSGQIYTIHQLLHGLMLPSGNDASLALAKWGGNILLITDVDAEKKRPQEKNEKKNTINQWAENNKYLKYKEDKLKSRRCYNRFIAQMNKRARTLGLQRTTYVNSHGLSNPHNKSCCLDLAILCQYAMQSHYFRSIVACRQFQAIIDKEIQVIVAQKSTKKIKKLRKQRSTTTSQDPEQMNLQQDLQGDSQWNKSDNDDQQDQIDRQLKQNSCQTSRKDNDIVLQKKIQMTKKPIKWVNTHKLVQKRQDYLGIKTGVTVTAGACLASYLKIGDRNFIIIVINSKKLIHRFSDTQILRRWLMKKQKLSNCQSKLDFEQYTKIDQF